MNAQGRREYPIGYRFKPTDKELVEFYLLPKLQGKPTVPNDAIIEADVYACDPEILINQMYRDRGEKRWHFLSPRTRKYQNGDRPSRRTADNRGRWKPSTGKKEKNKEHDDDDDDYEDEYEETEEEEPCVNGAVTFCVTGLAYYVGPPDAEKKTKWLMREITVPEYEIKVDSSVPGGSTTVLDRYAMCIVYISPLTKWHKDKKGGAASIAREEAASSSKTTEPAPESGLGEAAPTTLSEIQAGKRPAVEQQQLGRTTTTTKRARRPTRARGARPTPMHNNGGGGAMGVRPLEAGATGYYGAPGQLAPTIPWPPVTRNGLQGPVRLPQQRMYTHDGWPVAPSYGGQAPVQRLAGSSLRPPVSADNSPHRTMVMRSPSPASFGNEMVTRPPSPASFGNEMVTRPPSPASFGNEMVMRSPSPASFGNEMVMRPQTGPNLAAHQTFPPPSGLQPRRQLSDLDMEDPNTQRVISLLVAELNAQKSTSSSFDAAQQQGPAASNLPPPSQQQQQEPTFDAGANNIHPARANATVAQPGRGSQLHQQQQQQRSPSIPVTNMTVPGGEAAPASDHASSRLPVRGDADGGSGEGALESNADLSFCQLWQAAS